MAHLLLLDIGNTRLKWGIWAGGRAGPEPELLAYGAMPQQSIELLTDALLRNKTFHLAKSLGADPVCTTLRAPRSLSDFGSSRL